MIILKKRPRYQAIFVLSLCYVFSTTLLTACGDTDTVAPPHSRAESLHRVETVRVERKPVSLTQTISGTLEAVTRIRLYNEESGRITRLPFHEGDRVKKGTLLVQLDNELIKTDVAKARASREQAKVDLDRLKKLLPKNISTEEEVARARTELDLAIAEQKYQQTRLERTSIRAPFDGMITERLYEPGDMLAQQSHILTLIDPTVLRLRASLAERWIPLVRKGQDVELHIDALGDTRFAASVTRIHPTINRATHKGIIEIVLDPAPASATSGQFARAEIELTATDRTVIPVHTIHYEPEGSYVFRIIQNDQDQPVAKKVFFEQGQQFASVTEVLSQLKAGDRVVSRGFLGLRDNKRVEIANTDNIASGDKPVTTPQSAETVE